MRDDPAGRVACETLVNTGLVLVSGEITTETYVDIPAVARETIKRIGYTDAEYGFDYHTCAVINAIDKQSPDIAQGVERAYEARTDPADDDELDVAGAGDQGMMFGYATRETRRVDAAADFARAQARQAAGGRPQGGDGPLPATRRQDPGHRPLRRRLACGGGEALDLVPAPRRRGVAAQGRPLGARRGAGVARDAAARTSLASSIGSSWSTPRAGS